MTRPLTRDDIRNAIELVAAVGICIKDLKQVPSGELYSQICGKVTIENYNLILDRLKSAQLIQVQNHLITWIGE